MKYRYLRKIGDVSLKKQLIWNLERIICILTGWVRELCYAPGQPMFSYNLVVPDRNESPVPPRRVQDEPRLLYDSDTELNLDLYVNDPPVGVPLMTRQAIDVSQAP